VHGVAIGAIAAIAVLAGCETHLPHEGVPPDGGPIADGAPYTSGVSTLAGAASAGNVNGDRSHARFDDPVNVVVAQDGTVYVADFNNGEIRAVDQDGNVTTVVNKVGFARPYGMVFAADGTTMYVETDNDKTGGHSLTSGSVWTVDLPQGSATCIANAIGRPRGMVLLPDGSLAMSDELHHVIETLDPTTGALTTIAGAWGELGDVDGQGSAARFNTPYGMVMNAAGNLVVIDQGNNLLREVTLAGAVSTLAGNHKAGYVDGSLTMAEFNSPEAIAQGSDGSLYVTDEMNYRVRKVTSTGVTTVIGDGTPAWKDDSNPLQAEIYGLEGIAFNADDSVLYITDGSRGDPVPFNRVRFVMMGAVQ
jgi:sugar lactone lactonase YvrE